MPYAVGAAKRARSAAVRVRRRVERMHTVPALGAGVRPRPVLQTVYLAVLGGRTLNAAVVFPQRSEKLASARLELIRGSRRVSLDLVRKLRPDTHVVEFDCGHMILQLRPRDAWTAIATTLEPLR